MFRHHYRKGLNADESEMVRQLRLRGYAVFLVQAGAMRRGKIEDAMRRAAKNALKERTDA